MEVTIHGHGVEVTGTLRAHAEKKLQNILKYFDKALRVDIELEFRPIHQASERQVAQVTLSAAGVLMRAEERSADMYASIDMVFHKLEHQILKYKDKKIKGKRRERQKEKQAFVTAKSPERAGETGAGKSAELSTNGGGIPIIRVKKHAVKPISPEEAVEEMEMVGHDFYVFKNTESQKVSVVYRRDNGQYGLIEPDL